MSTELMGFLIGALFGALLFLGGLADPDKIIGTLRLKDFHALKTIAVFVLVSILGTWILESTGAANLSIKATTLLTVLIGGALLGIGFGLTGYCPGTGLACAIGGRVDAAVAVLGMLAGALVYIFIYPGIVEALNKVGNYGKARLPDVTGIPSVAWVAVIVGGGALALFLTSSRNRGKKTA